MEKELKFIHITKCAGTSIENIGIENNKEWGRYHKEYEGYWHTIFPLVNEEIKKKYDWFMVVRNPYTRILSEYYCEWGGIGKKNIIHTKEEMNVYLIDKINNRSSNGSHYTEQYKYYIQSDNVVIHILKFENLKEEFDQLMQKYNYPITLRTITNSKFEKNETLAFSLDDFSNELIQFINDVYQKDFEMFGYTPIPTPTFSQ